MALNSRFLSCLIFFLLSLPVQGCAGYLPLPGGGDDINRSFFTTQDDLLKRLNDIHSSMTEEEVFSALGHGEDELTRLERNQIVTALYGSSSVEFRDGMPEHEDSSRFLQSLYGYRLYYQILKRQHGFTSPIRIRTDEAGFDYAVTLIFRGGVLYERPILTGGVVNRSSSRTIFDYINPGTIMGRVAQ